MSFYCNYLYRLSSIHLMNVLYFSLLSVFWSLYKLLNSDGLNINSNLSKTNVFPAVVKDDILINIPDPNNYTNSSEPRIEDKRFKVKNRNKTKKESEKKTDKPVKQEIKVSADLRWHCNIMSKFKFWKYVLF